MNDDYLWDRSGPPDPEVIRLEALLGPLGHRELAPPRLPSGRAARSSLLFPTIALANAACVLLLAGLTWTHRGTGPTVAVTRLAGTPVVASRALSDQGELGIGHWLVTDADARASIDVAEIGRVEVDPDSRLSLLSSQQGNYRLQLQRGTMHAVIWAPPGQFFVETPSSTAVDLGCAYTLTVDDAGAGIVRVTSGWVGFEWRGRESFIPAGAACPTRRNLGPGTPYYEDTSVAFQRALSTLDFDRPDATAARAALDIVLAEARDTEIVTLWHLLTRVAPPDRDRVFDRLAGFVAPPAGVTRDGIRAGDRAMLDNWWDQLGLGTASWWRTWKQPWRTDKGDK